LSWIFAKLCLRSRRGWLAVGSSFRFDIAEATTHLPELGGSMAVSMTVPQYARREATIDGQRVFMTPAERDLLALLLIRGPRLTTREQMIEWLWPDPDREPETAQNGVEVRLSRLRKLLRTSYIDSRRALGVRLVHG
jgi:DNA-binding response OmpR family regulator